MEVRMMEFDNPSFVLGIFSEELHLLEYNNRGFRFRSRYFTGGLRTPLISY